MSQGKKRVFVSFDIDNDKAIKDFVMGQSRLPDFRYEVIDHSEKQAAPIKTWERKARQAIKGSELVMVALGPDTHRAPEVLKEVRIARRQAVPVVQIIVQPDEKYRPVPGAGRLYRWDSENLRELLTENSGEALTHGHETDNKASKRV